MISIDKNKRELNKLNTFLLRVSAFFSGLYRAISSQRAAVSLLFV